MLRRHPHHTRLATRVAVMAAMLLLVMAGPAGARVLSAGPADAEVLASAKVAAPVAAKAALAAKAPAPICVVPTVHRHWNINHVHLRNDCSYTVRVKVLIAFGSDSACEVLVPTETFRHSHLTGRFDGLVNC
jgi:hypothetical protein